jgi:integrase
VQTVEHNTNVGSSEADASLQIEANFGKPLKQEDFDKVARRRFQDPKPQIKGRFWYIRVWQDVFEGRTLTRKRQRIKLAPASMPEREAKKIAAEVLRPMNQGLISVGSAVNFTEYVDNTYNPTVLPLLAVTTQESYTAMIGKYLKPSFGDACLRDLSPLALQKYFSGMAREGIAHPSIVKVRDTLSSVLRSAVRFQFLITNPLDGLQLPPDKRGRRSRPFISPQQFDALVAMVPEPYATMLHVAVWTGLRVSELIGLKWRCVHADSLSIEERFCRGDWSAPKTQASAATIGVDPGVIARIQQLKTLTVDIRAGCAVRTYNLVKADGPNDLVFQSVKDGKPMRDNNVLKRFIKPAAFKLGIPFVNWRCLRTSHATWLVQAGADPKSVQGQMRHSRISTTMDIYAQVVPEAQRRAVTKLSAFAKNRVPERVPIVVQ